MATWALITLALVADGLAGLTGGLLSDRWLHQHQAGLIGFAAGALISAVFLDVLPESIEAFGMSALPWACVSFIALAVIEWLLGYHHPGTGEDPRSKSLPITLLASDALHNVGDGAAVTAAFLVSPRAGLAVALVVIAHEVPQEVGDYAVLRSTGFSRTRAIVALSVVQMTAALGAVGVALLTGSFRQISGAVLSMAAGSFLYIGATDLLPDLHAGRTSPERRERILGLLGGVGLIWVFSRLSV